MLTQLNIENPNPAETRRKISTLCPEIRKRKNKDISECPAVRTRRVIRTYCPTLAPIAHKAINGSIHLSEFYEPLIENQERLWKEAKTVLKFSVKIKRNAYKLFMTDPDNARIRFFGAKASPKSPPLIFLTKDNQTLILPQQLDQAYDDTWQEIIATSGPLRRQTIALMLWQL